MKPSIGRIVHLFDSRVPQDPKPAIITHLETDGAVSLTVFSGQLSQGCYGVRHIYQGFDSGDDLYWEWPQRDEEE